MKRSPIKFVCIIFSLVVFNSSGNEFHSCTNTCILNVLDPYNLPLYQVVLSFRCLIIFYFVLSPGMSLFRYMWSQIFKRNVCLLESEIILHNSSFFTQSVFYSDVVIGKPLVKCLSSLKKQIMKPFLRRNISTSRQQKFKTENCSI